MQPFERTSRIKAIKHLMYRYPLYIRCREFYYRHIFPIYYLLLACKVAMRNGCKSGTILTDPEMPSSKQVLFRLLHVLGYRLTNKKIAGPAAVIFYHDTTFPGHDDYLAELSKQYRIMNYRCGDISKARVTALFERAFGYPLAIDPEAWSGRCVKKSDLNTTHDGEVITCPIESREEGFIYQKLINNQVSDEVTYDIRTPVYGGAIPFVYYKYYRLQNRFIRKAFTAEIVETYDAFSPEEVRRIAAFCNEMGLDYGELDILRDRDDGSIYIVDANTTPGDLPVALSKAGRKRAQQRLALAFAKALVAFSPQRQ
jgi:hypothetical protein